MVIFKHLKATCFLAAASTVLLATGCSSTETDTAHSQAEITETTRLMHTQEASGARAECTLYADQFDGPTLSTLGTNSLDLMLADSHTCNPLVIYMAVPEDQYAQDRRLAIGRYLEDRGGLKAEQIEFRSGPNPDTFHAVDTQLGYYPKTDTAMDSTSGSSSASGSSSSSSASH
ncbi:MAG: hypothetical protein ABSD28_04420 [Tepidisphaeraceae bacterium]|jgi:hypothetical protein